MMRSHSLQRRLILVILGVGVLAIIINSSLLGTVLTRTLESTYGNELALRTRALTECCIAARPEVLRTLTERAATAGQGGTGARFALVVDPTGQPVANRWLPAAVETALLNAYQQHVLKPQGGWTTVAGMIVAQAPIVRAGQSVGTLVLAQNLREVYRIRGSLIVVAAWTGLLAVLVAALAGIFAARSIIRPIGDITAAARAIAAGNYKHRAPAGGTDETKELAGAFNAMIDDVLRQRQVERDLLANVSHELAAPLGIIRGYAEALADDVLRDRTHQEKALHAIAAESRRLSLLVGDLVDLALLEAGQATLARETVEPAELLADVRDRMAPAAEAAGITVRVEAARDRRTLSTDGVRLEGVLVNLITNALMHTPSGGTVTLRATESESGTFLVVEDTGSGIATADLPRIFERFYRGDKGRDRRNGAAGGAGLGLAICRQTISALGGTITAESALGQGATFTIWLPADSGGASPQNL